MSKLAIIRDGVHHGSLTSGAPSGRGHMNGIRPRLSACHSRVFAADSGPVGWRTWAPSTRQVATTSSVASRTFAPAEPANSGEATSARSTGTIAVSLSR